MSMMYIEVNGNMISEDSFLQSIQEKIISDVKPTITAIKKPQTKKKA